MSQRRNLRASALLALALVAGCTQPDKTERRPGLAEAEPVPTAQQTADANAAPAEAVADATPAPRSPATLTTLCDLLGREALATLGIFTQAEPQADVSALPERMMCVLRSPNYDVEYGDPADAEPLGKAPWTTVSISVMRRSSAEDARGLLQSSLATDQGAGMENQKLAGASLKLDASQEAYWSSEARMLRMAYRNWLVYVGVSNSLEAGADQDVAAGLLPSVVEALDRS